MAVAMLAVAGLLAMTLTPAQAADYDAIMQTIVSKSSQTYTEQLKQSQMMYPHYRYDGKSMRLEVMGFTTRIVLEFD